MSEEHVQVTREDVAEDNPKMLAGEMRALQREMRSGFELITTKLLTAIERFGQRLDDYGDRIANLERDVAVLKEKRRTPAGKR